MGVRPSQAAWGESFCRSQDREALFLRLVLASEGETRGKSSVSGDGLQALEVGCPGAFPALHRRRGSVYEHMDCGV